MSPQARAYKTHAIVLRTRTLGEADRIYTLFSTERGKMDAVAKGVRRSKSHLSGRMEFMNEVVLGMHRGRNLDVIVSAELGRAHWDQIVQPQAFAAASLVAELVDTFCEPDLALPDIYELLVHATAAIGSSPEPASLLPRFSLRLLAALGLTPPLDRCVRCGIALGADGAWVDAEQGGLAGRECGASWRETLDLDASDLANMRALAAERGGEIRPVARATPRVARAVESLVNHHLGRRPKAGLHLAQFVTG